VGIDCGYRSSCSWSNRERQRREKRLGMSKRKIELTYRLYWRIFIGDKPILDFEEHQEAEAFVKELYPSTEYMLVPLVVCRIRKQE